MEPQSYFNHIRQLIAQDKLDQALQQLRKLLDNTPQLNEVLQQSGRFADIRKLIRLGVVSHAEATLTRDQIRSALRELLDEIGKQQAQAPALREELASAVAIVQSKNVVANSVIIAGGDVHIGGITHQGDSNQVPMFIGSNVGYLQTDDTELPRLLSRLKKP
ncbi:MAG: hypothetical protein ACK4NS_12815 [Saprospiraceae bacterium]